MLQEIRQNGASPATWRTIARTSVVCGLILLGTTLVGLYTGTPLNHLTIDPADVLMAPAVIGLLSHFGIMLWAASAAFCIMGVRISGTGPGRRFLMASSVVCMILAFDDALLLHDRVFPEVVGIPETIVYIFYALGFGGYLVLFSKRILQTEFLPLGISVTFLVCSVLMDRILPFTPVETFIEDFFKFIGIVFWCVYFYHTVISTTGRRRDWAAGQKAPAKFPLEASLP